jgi:uncharacterized membrane protein YkoI
MFIVKSALPSAFAALLLAASPAAIAAAPAASPAGHPAASETANEHENKVELKTFDQAKISLADAIAAAEKSSSGKALGASFEDFHGKPAFHIRTTHRNGIWEGMVDAASGQVIGQGKTTPQNKIDREDQAEISAVEGGKTTLAAAVRTAEQKLSGKAMDAEVEERGGKVVYDVEILANGAVKKTSIDLSTGQAVSDAPSPGASSARTAAGQPAQK